MRFFFSLNTILNLMVLIEMYLYHTMIKNLTAGYVIFHNCGSCKLNSTYLVLMEINGSIKKHACTHASVHVIATVKCFVQ